MKKGVKLTILLLVLAIIVLSYFVVGNYLKKQNDVPEEPKEDTTVNVLKLSADSIVEIEFDIDKETISLKKTDGKWGLKEDSEFPIDTIYTGYMEKALSNVTAERVVAESLDNEADFGMNEPSKQIKYKLSDGTEYLYTIGSYNSAIEGYYFKISGQDKIYVSNSEAYDSFSFPLLEMIETEQIPVFDAEDVIKVEYTLDGKKHTLTTDPAGMDYYVDAYTYFYIGEDGVKRAADGKLAAALAKSVTELSLGSVIEYRPSADKLSSLGFGENKAFVLKVIYTEDVSSDSGDTSVTVKTEKDYEIYVGRATEADSTVSYYAMIEGSHILYKLNMGEELYKAVAESIESKLACPMLLEDMIEMKIESGSDTYTHQINEIEGSEKLKGIFNSLTALVSERIGDGKKGETVIKVTFDIGGSDVVFEVNKYDDKYYVASFDKKNNMLISSEKINEIINKLK